MVVRSAIKSEFQSRRIGEDGVHCAATSKTKNKTYQGADEPPVGQWSTILGDEITTSKSPCTETKMMTLPATNVIPNHPGTE